MKHARRPRSIPRVRSPVVDEMSPTTVSRTRRGRAGRYTERQIQHIDKRAGELSTDEVNNSVKQQLSVQGPRAHAQPKQRTRYHHSLRCHGQGAENVRLVVRHTCTGQFFMCPCVKLGCCTHDIERDLSRAARAPLSRLTVSCGFYFGKNANPTAFIGLVCVSVTTTRACLPRTRHHCNRRPHCSHRRRDREDGFTKFMCYSFGSQHSGTCTRQHSCVLVLLGWIPKHVREHVMAIHAVWKVLQTQRGLICFATKFTCNFHCMAKLF